MYKLKNALKTKLIFCVWRINTFSKKNQPSSKNKTSEYLIYFFTLNLWLILVSLYDTILHKQKQSNNSYLEKTVNPMSMQSQNVKLNQDLKLKGNRIKQMFEQTLPLGSSNFSSLRQANEIYVDKTDLIYKLAKNRGKIFLARPRRFGKSLLVSTFESLFKKGLQDFKNLKIEKLWTDKTYTVVRFDFSEVKEFSNADDFERQFNSLLISRFEAAGFNYSKNDYDVLIQLSNWLSSLASSSLVILIDEYDAPLTNCLDKPELFKEIRSIMSRLFLTLKANEGCLRFFFMTGITKFSNTSIFSAFNNLQDISLNPVFGTLLGYTENEIHNYFNEYLSHSAKVLNVEESQLLDQLRENYNGFSFDLRAQTHVYCPWSVLNFFNYPELGFQNYWYSSGGQPSVLMNYLVSHVLAKPDSYAEAKPIRLSELEAPRQYDDMNLEVLLNQAGYLTIREVTPDRYALLGYPNQEVAISMAELYADELLDGKRLQQIGQPSISEVLSNGSVEDVVRQFNSAVNSIDYQKYPIVDEASCRAYLQVLLIGAAMLPKVEIHTAHGRSDLEVNAGKRHWVFEFKYTKNDQEAEKLLEKAVQQMENRRYGQTDNFSELRRVALIFSEKNRSFITWQEV